MGAGKGARFGARGLPLGSGEPQERAHLIKRKTEPASAAYETEPRNIFAVVATKAAVGAAGLGQEGNPLVVSDRLDIASGSP